ncbi:MAG: cation diffusion facilitator family transporter [Gammaproteobacteria bacterium]|nr:cation diffusion facilitator family transporter [Gammaproteobacteria bacterium]
MTDHSHLSRQATIASVTVALILIITKTWAYWSTGSVSLLGSLLDSMLDGVTSLINFIALRFALVPADDDHKFGHGKLESIAALAQSAFMVGSAVVLVLNSFDVMIDKRQMVNSHIGVGVSILAIVLTLALVAFQRYVIKRSKSLIVEADSLHYQGDLLMNGAVLLAMALVGFGWYWIDAVMAIGIGVFLCVNAWHVGAKAFKELMDQQLPEVEAIVEQLVRNEHGPEGCHDVRCRQSGPDLFIQFHLELDENLALWSAHEIGDRIEKKIKESYPNADVLIHHDPVKVEG